MGVAIARLKLRGPPERAAMARFAIEDGIRTSWPDDERLVLIRHVALGRTRPDQRPDRRRAQFRTAWEAATQGRRHGGDSGAGAANCVWFASRGEAWQLLLRELLAGRRPDAWFWRLAVPGWQGEPAREWLAEALSEALAGRGPIEPMALVETVLAEGGADLLLAAAERIAAAPALLPIAPALEAIPTVRDAELGTAAAEEAAREALLAATVLAIRGQLPARLVATIEALALRVGVQTAAAHALIERLLLRGSPALRLTPEQLTAAIRIYATMLDTGRVPGAPAVQPASAAIAPDPIRPEPSGTDPAVAPRSDDGVTGSAQRTRESPESTAPAPETAITPPPLAALLDEARSRFAGLWLVVPALVRLGFREWLAAHPDLAAADGGRRLIRAIARHHGVVPEDPALAPFADCAPDDPDFARPWRIGLDHYLWRHARIRLAEVIRREGWLRTADERLILRFDPESVDLRLRRHALDVDPGWTDWLGLSIRYRYTERGEP